MECQYRDFPTELCCNTISYNYVQVTCFTTFYRLDPYSFLKFIIFLYSSIKMFIIVYVVGYLYLIKLCNMRAGLLPSVLVICSK